MTALKFDTIGYWSEIKLDILRDYAKTYSTVLSAQTRPQLSHLYIDGFAGTGQHVSKVTGEFVAGSPLNALLIDPPFKEIHLIDLDAHKVDNLRKLTQGYPNVHVYKGDCNEILLNEVFPRARYEEYRRALCLLDPYGLHLNWEVIETAGKMKSIEIFLNFPVMDMNMNVLWKNPDKVDPAQAARMDSFWGDRSWRDVAYVKVQGLFEQLEEKASNDAVANAFRDRMKKVAGFSYVPTPMPMRNSSGAIVYYLFFASPNKTGSKIVTDIFEKYRNRGIR